MTRSALLTTLIIATLSHNSVAQDMKMTVGYMIAINNMDEEIVCDTFSFERGKGMCREGSALYTYRLEDVQKVTVFNGTRSFTFSTTEMLEDRGELLAAFNVINEQKYREMAESRARYLDQVKDRESDSNDIVTSGSLVVGGSGLKTEMERWVDSEKASLREQERSALKRCNKSTGTSTVDCINETRARYLSKQRLLEADPDRYLDSTRPRYSAKEKHNDDAVGTIHSGRGNGQTRPGIIHGTDGRVLNRAAGGYTDNYGTFYSDAAGGIVNSKTGEFVPVH